MADVVVEVDCSSGAAVERPMTVGELADRAATVAAEEARRTAERARRDDRRDAVRQLKAAAKTKSDLALVLRALGIDPNDPGDELR